MYVKVYFSLSFDRLTHLCNHHHNQIEMIFITSKGMNFLGALQSQTPHHPAPGNQGSAFCHYRFHLYLLGLHINGIMGFVLFLFFILNFLLINMVDI